MKAMLQGAAASQASSSGTKKSSQSSSGQHGKKSSGQESKGRNRSSSNGSRKGANGKKTKPTSRSGAAAQIMNDYALGAALLSTGYRDDEEFDYTRRHNSSTLHNAMVGVRVDTDSEDETPPPSLADSSDSEIGESDDSIHSGIADSVNALSDDDQELATAARPSAFFKGRLFCQGHQPRKVSWGCLDSTDIIIEGAINTNWRSVARRPRNPSYRHDDSRRRLAGSSRSALDVAKRLSNRVGTFKSSNPRRLHSLNERRRLQEEQSCRHSVSAATSSTERQMRDGYPRMLIADTGAGVNLMSRHELDSDAIDRIENLARPIRLNTANGVISTDEVLPMELPVMDDTLDFVLLENTPAVVSVGERCMAKGYGFYWPPNGDPFFVLPGDNGETRRVVPLKTTRHVPMIINGTVARRVPKGWIRRRLSLAADGDSQESSGSEHSQSSSAKNQ